MTLFTLQRRKLREPTHWKVGQVIYISDLLSAPMFPMLVISSPLLPRFPLNSQRNSVYLPSAQINLVFLLASLLNLLSNISLTVSKLQYPISLSNSSSSPTMWSSDPSDHSLYSPAFSFLDFWISALSYSLMDPILILNFFFFFCCLLWAHSFLINKFLSHSVFILFPCYPPQVTTFSPMTSSVLCW